MSTTLPQACVETDSFLVELAYGEESSVPASAREHLATCERCQAELRALSGVRAAASALPLEEPSEKMDAAVLAALDAHLSGIAAEPPPAEHPHIKLVSSNPDPKPAAKPARPRRWQWTSMAAAASIAVVAGGTWLLSQNGNLSQRADQRAPAEALVRSKVAEAAPSPTLGTLSTEKFEQSKDQQAQAPAAPAAAAKPTTTRATADIFETKAKKGSSIKSLGNFAGAGGDIGASTSGASVAPEFRHLDRAAEGAGLRSLQRAPVAGPAPAPREAKPSGHVALSAPPPPPVPAAPAPITASPMPMAAGPAPADKAASSGKLDGDDLRQQPAPMAREAPQENAPAMVPPQPPPVVEQAAPAPARAMAAAESDVAPEPQATASNAALFDEGRVEVEKQNERSRRAVLQKARAKEKDNAANWQATLTTAQRALERHDYAAADAGFSRVLATSGLPDSAVQQALEGRLQALKALGRTDEANLVSQELKQRFPSHSSTSRARPADAEPVLDATEPASR